MALPIIPKVIIPLPSAIASNYNTDAYFASLFDGDNLIIQVSERTKYTPMFEGTETKNLYGTRGVIRKVGQKCYGFTLEIYDGRSAIYNSLQEYRDFLYNDPAQPLSMQILDYVNDEGEESGFKTRTGYMLGLQNKPGIALRIKNQQQRKLTPGLTFKFKENNRRFIGQ